MSGGMPMPGGWTMSMAWMRMPGQTRLDAAASFLAMWVVMMVAMMLPSLVPMLARYRRGVRARDETSLDRLSALAGAGYFAVWTIFGAAVYPVGLALGAAEMRWKGLARSVPIATGLVLLLAGGLQLTAWKVRQLGHCREAPGGACALAPDANTAWRHGLGLGVHCARCCSGLMAVLLVTGVMDLGAMGSVATAITVERLAPSPAPAARAVGALVMAVGALVVVRAASVR